MNRSSMKGSQLNARTTLSAHHRGLSKEPGLKSIFRHLVTSSLSHNTFLNNFFSWIYKKSQRKHSLTAWKSISAQTEELLEILRKLGKRSVTSKKNCLQQMNSVWKKQENNPAKSWDESRETIGTFGWSSAVLWSLSRNGLSEGRLSGSRA